jgi:hypothetical protein
MSVAKSHATRWGQLAFKRYGVGVEQNIEKDGVVGFWGSRFGNLGLSVRRILSAKTALHDSSSVR